MIEKGFLGMTKHFYLTPNSLEITKVLGAPCQEVEAETKYRFLLPQQCNFLPYTLMFCEGIFT
jgi:hypothetical protein